MSRFQRCAILIFAVALYSIDNVLLKALPVGTSPMGVIVIACALAIPILTLYFKKHLNYPIPLSEHIFIASIALAFVAFSFLNILSLQYIGVDDSTFIFSLTVAIVPLINVFWGKSSPWPTWLGVIIIVSGVWFVSSISYSDEEVGGYFISLGGATVRAFFLIGLNYVSKRVNGKIVLVELIWWVTLLAGICWLIQEPHGLMNFDYGLKTMAIITAFSMLSIVVANSIIIIMQKYATAVETAVALSLQLIFTVLIMSVIPPNFEQPEVLTITNVAGCIMIAVGSILATCDIKKEFSKCM